MNLTHYLLSVMISLAIGMVGFIAAFKIFDWLTPEVHFGQELKAGNLAVAVFCAGLFVGIGFLLGGAVK